MVDLIRGTVSARMYLLDDVYVVNLSNEKTVITDVDGQFQIHAKVGDSLMFSKFQFQRIKVKLTQEDFNTTEGFQIKMYQITNQLNEVVIRRYDHINAVDLGIIAANTPHYTPAERRLKAASGIDINSNSDGTAGGNLGVDPLINLISGRTAMLKKELEIEKKEMYIKKLSKLFPDDFLIHKLKIPVIYTKGFLYYAVENKSFVGVMDREIQSQTEFFITQLAEKYKVLIAEDPFLTN